MMAGTGKVSHGPHSTLASGRIWKPSLPLARRGAWLQTWGGGAVEVVGTEVRCLIFTLQHMLQIAINGGAFFGPWLPRRRSRVVVAFFLSGGRPARDVFDVGGARHHQFERAVANDVPRRLPVDNGAAFIATCVRPDSVSQANNAQKLPSAYRTSGTRGSFCRRSSTSCKRRFSPCEPNHIHRLSSSIRRRGERHRNRTLSRQRAPGASSPLGSNGGDRGAPVQPTHARCAGLHGPPTLTPPSDDARRGASNPERTLDDHRR
jgi:hypothetical protein